MSERTVRIRLEAATKGYEQQMGAARSATEGLRDAHVDAQGRMRDASGKFVTSQKQVADETTKSHERQRRSLATWVGENEKSVQAMERSGKALTKSITAPLLALGAVVGATGVSYNALEQRSRAALTTMLGSAEAATAQMEKLHGFVRESPFPRQAFIEAQQQLIGFGMEAERVIPILAAVQDAVAATGGSAQDIAEIVDVMARIQGQGKITGIELQRLGIRGIDAAGMIADAMGVTEAEIRDRISAGALDAETALDALVMGIDAKMGGAAENVKRTWDGAADRVKAAFRDLSSAVVEPFVSVEGGGAAVDGANSLADGLRNVETAYRNMEPWQQTAMVSLGGVAAAVGPVLWGVGKLGRAWLNTTENLRQMQPLMSGMSRFLTGPWGIALLGATVAAGAFAKAKIDAAARVRELTDAIKTDTYELGANTRAHVASRLEQEGALKAARDLGLSMQTVTDAAMGNTSALGEVEQVTRGTQAAYQEAIAAGEGVTNEMTAQAAAGETLTGSLGGLAPELALAAEEARRLGEANGELMPPGLAAETERLTALAAHYGVEASSAADSTGELGSEMGDLEEQIDEATSALEAYMDALRSATDPVFALVSALDDVEDAQAEYEATLADTDATQQQVDRSALKLAEAVAKAEAAALNGELSFDQFSDKLDEWVASGRITAEQAEVIRDRVAEATDEAKNYEGGYMATLAMDVGQAMGALDEFMDKLRAAGFSRGDAAWAARYQAQANATFPQVPDPMGDGPGRARGGNALRSVQQSMAGLPGLRVSSTYRTPEHNRRVGGSPTSYHLDRNNPAVDVAGPMSSLDALHGRLRRLPHRELIWRAPGHWDHVHFANRGMLIPGTGNQDTVPAMLTPGEWVINADAVDRYGPAIFDALNSERLDPAVFGGQGDRPGEVIAPAGEIRTNTIVERIVERSGPSGPSFEQHFHGNDARTMAYEARHQARLQAAEVGT